MGKNALVLLSLIILFSANGVLAGEKQELETSDIKTKGEKEILVAQDVTTDRPFWCGPSGRLIYVKEHSGLFYYDVKTGKSVNVADVWSSPSACSPDGEWLVYEDKETVRWDNGSDVETVVDVWRYEFKTGKSQKFIIADDGDAGEGFFPPGRLKIYLNRRPTERMDMPEPEWDILWSRGKGVGRLWLGDGSAVIGGYRDLDRRRDVLEVEVFSPKRKIISIYPEFPDFYLLLVDKQNRVYMEKRDSEKGMKSIVRCVIDIDRESLSCETVLEDVSMDTGFDVFSDGETMVFSRMRDDDCVRILRVGEGEARCITTSGLPVGSFVVISPDQKWLAFERARHIEAKDFYDDLYLLELKYD
jgi:hypothetical protein